MTHMELIDIIKRILNTDADIRFLNKLDESELETLIACIRDRVDQIQEEWASIYFPLVHIFR